MSNFRFEKECFPSSPFFFQQAVLTSQKILSSWGIIPLFYLLSIHWIFSPDIQPMLFFCLTLPVSSWPLSHALHTRDIALYLFCILQESLNHCKICKSFSESWSGNFLVSDKMCYYFSLEVILCMHAHM